MHLLVRGSFDKHVWSYFLLEVLMMEFNSDKKFS